MSSWTIRPVRPEDHGFVHAGWIRSYASSDWAAIVTPKTSSRVAQCDHCGAVRVRQQDGGKAAAGKAYWVGHDRLIARVLERGTVLAAEASEPAGLLDGFVAFERPVTLHYVYVRLSARGQGLARLLVAAAFGQDAQAQPIVYSHRARSIRVARLPEPWVFDPYILMRT